MKYLSALFALVVVAGLAACSSGVQLPAVSPEDVEVFMPGSTPREQYKLIANVVENVRLSTSDDDVIEMAVARAAELGADALIIQAIRRTTEGGEMDLNREERKILEGQAVYFPARHPELEGQ